MRPFLNSQTVEKLGRDVNLLLDSGRGKSPCIAQMIPEVIQIDICPTRLGSIRSPHKASFDKKCAQDPNTASLVGKLPAKQTIARLHVLFTDIRYMPNVRDLGNVRTVNGDASSN